MNRAKLVAMARQNMAHVEAGSGSQTAEVRRVLARHYTEPARFELEVSRIFRRLPLVLALSTECAEPGTYRALNAVGVPVLLCRDAAGEVRAFVNMCRHRGSQLVAEGRGRARRFVCPYHAWSYNLNGALTGVLRDREFGAFDRHAHGLISLPVLERAGLIWVTLDSNSKLDIATFLSGYDELLESFHFENWKLYARREIAGPNWKIAYDGYLDLYHLPILHKDSFGADFPNQAIYHAFGPHQRVDAPNPALCALEKTPEEKWPTELLNAGVWTIFPHVSIATFDAGARSVLVSQLFPGERAGESRTVQSWLVADAPASDAQRAELDAQWELLEHVVEREDYATGFKQQAALRSGAMKHVLFGQNEGGGQAFHAWLERLLKLDDEALTAAFDAPPPVPSAHSS